MQACFVSGVFLFSYWDFMYPNGEAVRGEIVIVSVFILILCSLTSLKITLFLDALRLNIVVLTNGSCREVDRFGVFINKIFVKESGLEL